jgi:phospholipase/carboxylesterase
MRARRQLVRDKSTQDPRQFLVQRSPRPIDRLSASADPSWSRAMFVAGVLTTSIAHVAGQLRARPPSGSAAIIEPLPAGACLVGGTRVHVPAFERPAGVLVMLHGAGATAEQALCLVRAPAVEAGVIVIAPQAQGATWDFLRGGFGPDVARVDRALAAVFAGHAIDPERIAIGGFSDGASYALTLGLANGDLFRSVLAFSPGFEAAPIHKGRPRVFIAHGTGDPVLPIDRTSHRIVPALQRLHLDVRYHEFDGGHVVPPDVVREAMTLLAA